MMTSKKKDLSSKDLNTILPSYLINEVESIKSEKEEKKSKLSEEFNSLNSPFLTREKDSKNETSFTNTPNSDKSLECSNESSKNKTPNLSPDYNVIFVQSNKNDSPDSTNDVQENKNEINSSHNCNNYLGNNNYSLLNMNREFNKTMNNIKMNENIAYLNKDNYKNLYFNNLISNHNKQKYNNNGLYMNNHNFNNNFSFYLNPIYEQNNYNTIPFMFNNSNIGFGNLEENIKIKNDLNILANNFSYNSQINNYAINNINTKKNPKINSINNYFNNINNINIIHNNYIDNQNYNNYNSPYIIPNDFFPKNNNNIYSSQNNNNNLDEFIKYINSLSMPLVNFLCTPKGTLEIQKKLEKSSKEYKVLLVNILRKQGLSKIMKNIYGNYFFQQLIKNTENSFIALIISYISEDIVEISKDFQGTFCLQALLDKIISLEDEQKFLNSIKNYEMEMAFNKNATHVLQKLVLVFPDIHRLYLNEIILNNFISLCLDSNGICLIKNFMKTNTIINNKIRINEKIKNNFVLLAESPFGNYGVQFLMELWNENDLKDIKEKILENIQELSLQQFSSNVIEKAIEIFSNEPKEKMIRKLFFENNFIIRLINSKFGKFVLNKAIKYMSLEMINELELYLNNDINNIVKNRDKNKIKKLLIKINFCKKNLDIQ